MGRCHIDFWEQSAEDSACSGLMFAAGEQALNVPFWLITTTPVQVVDAAHCKTQMIAADTRAVLHILRDAGVASAEIYVVLPA